jgi:hypothetical protein
VVIRDCLDGLSLFCLQCMAQYCERHRADGVVEFHTILKSFLQLFYDLIQFAVCCRRVQDTGAGALVTTASEFAAEMADIGFAGPVEDTVSDRGCDERLSGPPLDPYGDIALRVKRINKEPVPDRDARHFPEVRNDDVLVDPRMIVQDL